MKSELRLQNFKNFFDSVFEKKAGKVLTCSKNKISWYLPCYELQHLTDHKRTAPVRPRITIELRSSRPKAPSLGVDLRGFIIEVGSPKRGLK